MKKKILYLVFGISLLSMLGSLYFSEVMKLPPCVLCWYQRIFMYPIVFVTAVGILQKAQDIFAYILPLSIVGLLIASYHNLLYYGLIPESMAPCVSGISCTTKQIEWLGFITIPLLSLVSFALITISMIYMMRVSKK